MAAITTYPARYSVLAMSMTGDLTPVGILLHDPAADRLYIRLRRDWDRVAPDQADVLAALEADISAKAGEMGASRLLAHFEDTLSNAIQISDSREIIVEDFSRALDRLYRTHVNSTVSEFVTHLPRYTLQIAAGMFLENKTPEAEGWEEAPQGLRLTREMFVAKVVGRSMEPLIPDGSLCIFRHGVAGSRENKLVLVENRGESGDNRYTVKRYRSEKTGREGGWRHARIHLQSLNPEYPSWDLDPEESKYSVLAEFVRVLD